MTCGGFLPNSRRTTHPFDYDMFAGNLARAMKYARARGLTIAYHNHRGCIVETGAEVRQLAERLPQLRLCIDTGHLEAVGDDSAAFIRAHGKRIVYTHIKDFSWRKDSFVELGKGDGSLNVAACIKLLARQGYDGWLTVELDKTWPRFAGGSPLQSARACRRYLTRCGC
jgi:inosose dehydratase